MISNIDRLVQLQIQLHEWKEEDLNNYKRKIAEQQKEIPEGSSSEEILAIEESKREISSNRGTNYICIYYTVSKNEYHTHSNKHFDKHNNPKSASRL